jgi:hypothetical protein
MQSDAQKARDDAQKAQDDAELLELYNALGGNE